MSFDIIERSNYDAKPIVLYEFNIGSNYWRYSGDEIDTVLGSDLYVALPISDGGITQSGDGQNNDLIITLPATAEIVTLFRHTPPSEELWVTIRRKQRGDNDAPVVWVGSLASSKDVGLRSTELNCQVISATFNRNGVRLGWGRQCPHALYDRNCRVNKAAYAAAMTVSALTGSAVYSPALAAYAAGHFSNGFFEFAMLPGVIERRSIEFHSGDWITVLGTTEGMTSGMSILVYPGCGRTSSECNTKFNNLSNYGGFPHMPGKSPFDGDPIF